MDQSGTCDKPSVTKETASMLEFIKSYDEELDHVIEQKNDRYGNSVMQALNEFGLLASVIRIQDKFNRFKNIATNKCSGTIDESIVDTLDDMINYAKMTRYYIETCMLKEKDKQFAESIAKSYAPTPDAEALHADH